MKSIVIQKWGDPKRKHTLCTHTLAKPSSINGGIFSRDLHLQDAQGRLSILNSVPTAWWFWSSLKHKPVGKSSLIPLPLPRILRETGKDQSPEELKEGITCRDGNFQAAEQHVQRP